MSVANVVAENYSAFHKTLIFFMKLAWRSRLTLPYLIMIGFMVLDIRLTLEIAIDVDYHTPEGSEVNQGEYESDSDQEFETQQLEQ